MYARVHMSCLVYHKQLRRCTLATVSELGQLLLHLRWVLKIRLSRHCGDGQVLLQQLAH